MATTTNYGWTTPDDTALVKDGASAIRTLGTSIDTTTKNLNPSTTLGDIEYRSATANTNTRLGIGSTGNVLTVSGGVPVWAAPAGGGKVLQVVQGSTSTEVSSSSTTYVDTNLTATITPTSATSKILVLVTQNGLQRSVGNSDNAINLRLSLPGGSTVVFGFYLGFTNTTLVQNLASSFNYLHSPATTSAITYKTQFANANPTSLVKVQADNNTTSTITLLEIGA
jgi:hypothetical protein